MKNDYVHGCSEKQARSLGSHATRHLLKGLHKKGFRQLDVYSLDMNEELSGLSGYHLWDQVQDLAHRIHMEPISYSIYRNCILDYFSIRHPLFRSRHSFIVNELFPMLMQPLTIVPNPGRIPE